MPGLTYYTHTYPARFDDASFIVVFAYGPATDEHDFELAVVANLEGEDCKIELHSDAGEGC